MVGEEPHSRVEIKSDVTEEIAYNRFYQFVDQEAVCLKESAGAYTERLFANLIEQAWIPDDVFHLGWNCRTARRLLKKAGALDAGQPVLQLACKFPDAGSSRSMDQLQNQA